MDTIFWLTLAHVALLAVFDFTNGFHDTANMVVAVVATQAMTPVQAIVLVSGFTFLGPLLGGTAVADTLGQFITLENYAPAAGVAIVLSGAIAWNLLT